MPRTARHEDELTARIRQTLQKLGAEVGDEEAEIEATLKIMRSGRFAGHTLRQLQRTIMERNDRRCRRLISRKATLYAQIVDLNVEIAATEARNARLLFPGDYHDWGMSSPR